MLLVHCTKEVPMSWDNHVLSGVVWKFDGLRHYVLEWCKDGYDWQWGTLCGSTETERFSDGGKKPRCFKHFVTCLQCLAKGDRDP